MIDPIVRNRLRVLACLLGAVVAFGGPASAQQEDPRATARTHLGPIYFTPTIELRDLGVDSNVYNGEANKASDFTFSLVPTVVAVAGVPRALLTLRSATDLVYFSEQRSERSVNQDFIGSGRFSFRRVTFLADGGYLNTRQRPSEEIDARSRRIDRRGLGGVSVTVSPKLSGQVTGELARTTFDPDAIFDDVFLATELNRDTRTIAVSVRYAATPLTSIVVTTDAVRTEFPLAPVRDSDSRQTQFGLEFAPRALITGSVRVGFQRFRPHDAVLPEFDGLVGSADVSYRFNPSTSVGFGFNRNLAYSYFEEEPYYVREGYGLSLRRRLIERWDVEVSGARYWHRYRPLGAVPVLAVDERSDALFDGSVEFGYQLRQATRISVGLAYRDRSSDYSYRSYDSFRVGTSVVHGF